MNLKKIRENEMHNELERKRMQQNGQSAIYEMDLKIKREAQKQKLKEAEHQTEQLALDNELLAADKEFKQDQELERAELEMQKECLTDNVLKAQVLDTTQRIYQRLRVSEMKVVNMGGADN